MSGVEDDRALEVRAASAGHALERGEIRLAELPRLSVLRRLARAIIGGAIGRVVAIRAEYPRGGGEAHRAARPRAGLGAAGEIGASVDRGPLLESEVAESAH